MISSRLLFSKEPVKMTRYRSSYGASSVILIRYCIHSEFTVRCDDRPAS